MKKKVAKLFKKYGEKKIEIIKEYQPKTKGEKTVAIRGSRMDINIAIGVIMQKASKEELKEVGMTLAGTYLEDWDSGAKLVIKY